MKEFATGHIRNVALVAHHGVGKTSLAEVMLYQAKATNRIGRVADGTTLLDHSPEEIARQMTIDLGLAQFEFQRSEERRVGKECTSWCRSRWSPYH